MGALRRAFSRFIVLCLLTGAWLATGFIPGNRSPGAAGKTPSQPRLIVFIAVDQMRADYVERFRSQFTGGLKLLLEQGAVFTNAHHDHATTVTASGHASLLSGLYPASSGIIGNSWFDRRRQRRVVSVKDKRYRQLDDPQRGVSPLRLNGTTLGAWLKAKDEKVKVVSISRKDRAAALMVGKDAKQVYWYTAKSGGFTTSAYYQQQLPQWVVKFNARQVLNQYVGKHWTLLLGPKGDYRASRADDFPNETGLPGFGRVFPHPLPDAAEPLRQVIVVTPWMDAYTLQFAEEALKQLGLGRDDAPDLLAISLSTTDAIGHLFGPYSKEIQDQILRLDRRLGAFFNFLDKQVGLDHTLVALSSDHGVAPLPEYAAKLGKMAKRFQLQSQVRAYRERLQARFGEGRWMLDYSHGVFYFDRDALKQKGIALADVNRDAADYFRKLEPVARAYTREQLMNRRRPADVIERRLRHSFNPDRSGDVFLVFKPYYLESDRPFGTSHGSPYDYDTHVPLVIMGQGVKAGRYDEAVATVDLAPTLAAILGIEPLNPVDGRARKEILRGTH